MHSHVARRTHFYEYLNGILLSGLYADAEWRTRCTVYVERKIKIIHTAAERECSHTPFMIIIQIIYSFGRLLGRCIIKYALHCENKRDHIFTPLAAFSLVRGIVPMLAETANHLLLSETHQSLRYDKQCKAINDPKINKSLCLLALMLLM